MAYALTTAPTTTSTTASTSPAQTGKIRCKCGHLAKRLTSRSEKNPGRVFYQCFRGRDDPTNCKFFVWEDMMTDNGGSSDATLSKPTPSSPVSRYNATLAAKASPIPKAGNYSKAFGGTTQGYTLGGPSPLRPITSIPHPPPPVSIGMQDSYSLSKPDHAQSSQEGRSEPLALPTTPDELAEIPASQFPDMTIGAGWNSAKKRAMAKKRREVMIRALKGKNSDESSADEEEEDDIVAAGVADEEVEPDSIETFEPVDRRRDAHAKEPKQKSDDFDSDGISWGQVDADAIEASASQQATRVSGNVGQDVTPRNTRQLEDGRTRMARSSPPSKTTFIERLKAVNDDQHIGSASKKRKLDHYETEDGPPVFRNIPSDSSVMDGGTTPSYVSACGTLTPPETERRVNLGAFSSANDLARLGGTLSASDMIPSASACLASPMISMATMPGGSAPIHPLLEALNKDLVRRDRKAAADEKSREMLRGRVKALEGRVRELEAELRRVKSERR